MSTGVSIVGAGLSKFGRQPGRTGPQLALDAIQAALPEAIYVDASDSDAVESALEQSDAVAAGPGLGTAMAAVDVLAAVTGGPSRPTVLDADALNALAAEPERCYVVGTESVPAAAVVGRAREFALAEGFLAGLSAGVGGLLVEGEAGIGKSRLVQVLQSYVATEPQTWLTLCQCSPYHQNTAWYPLIDLLERVVLRFARDESPPQKLRKLEGFLVQHGLPLAATVLVAVAVALLFMFVQVPASDWVWPSGGFLAGLGIGALAAFAVSCLALPFMDATTRHDSVRFE